jgi:hypothetical protein
MDSITPPPATEVALQQIAETQEAERTARNRLAEFLASGPLYSQLVLDEKAKDVIKLPETIELHCAGECAKVQTFERVWVKGDAEYDKGWGKVVTYQCRNCGKKDQKYMYFWGDAGFLKVGQIPELREAIDPRLDAALAESSGLYQKAVRSRSLGFGIGALAYLRRIVEDRTDELMELLRANKWDEWTQEEKEQFEVARTTYQYSQKIAYATEKILPPAMSAEGRDSFAALHDVTSNGFHGKTEEKCIEIFDRCNLIFAYSFRVLSEHKREREEFTAKLQALNE